MTARDRLAGRPLRVLVDQSGYDLLNLGDVAMLQACVRRFQQLRPDALIAVLCHDPVLLDKYCPGAVAVAAGSRRLPRGAQLRRLGVIAAQAWKIVGPYSIRRAPRAIAAEPVPQHWRAAVRWADVVVASGGGYITDTWWWHGAGVLSLLAAAQRLGKPTAMFGQGLGPLTHRLLRRQAAAVMPRLALLGLRGAETGEPLARELGVSPDVWVVTGDDALEIVDLDQREPLGDAVGVNVRISAYSGVDAASADPVGAAVARFVTEHGIAARVLPVSLFAGSSDAGATQHMLAGRLAADVTIAEEVHDPGGLAAAVSPCRVVITGSYHAAVFALARGIPVVGLSKSEYYDVKFANLAGLFPGAIWLVRLGDDATSRLLSDALEAAWDAAPTVCDATRARAQDQAEAGRRAYQRFLERARI